MVHLPQFCCKVMFFAYLQEDSENIAYLPGIELKKAVLNHDIGLKANAVLV